MKPQQKFPGDTHCQVYHAVREYPRAIAHTAAVAFMLGCVVMTCLYIMVYSAQY